MKLWKNSLCMRKFIQTMIIKNQQFGFVLDIKFSALTQSWRMETKSSSDMGAYGKSVTSHRSLPGTEISIHRSGETHTRFDVLRKCSGWFWHRGRLGTLSQGSIEHKRGLLMGWGQYPSHTLKSMPTVDLCNGFLVPPLPVCGLLKLSLRTDFGFCYIFLHF